jgi:hypothetical protein
MQRGSSRQILIIVLVILILALLGLAIFISIRLQQSQTPPPTAAAICCGPVVCNGNSSPPNKSAGEDCNAPQTSCQQRAEEFCGVGNVANAGNSCPASCTPTSSGGVSCTNHYNGTTGFHLCPGTYQIQTCNCPSGTGTSYPSCVCNENCTTQTVTVTEAAGRDFSVNTPSCGTAQLDNSLFGGGVCAGAGQACGTTSSSSSSSGGPVCGDGVKATSEQCDPDATPTGCSTGQTCSDSCLCLTPDAPVCGDACTNNTQCPTNHSCTGGACVLNGCTATSCANGCTPLCGGPCDPGAGTSQCPLNHTCDPTSSLCVLNACLGNTSCTNNGCTLPVTALVSDEFDRILMGAALFILGILALKFKWMEKIENGLAYLNTMYIQDTNRSKRELNRTRSKFEQRFDKK